jgi:guanine nucleotide-binding protein G(i) subunit alpha
MPDYVPTEIDVLRSRVRTTGITEIKFSLDGFNMHMFDVGGQRSERKKWIHCFADVTSIFFIVALSEYDQVLLEDERQNRMAESLILFESVVNSRWFSNSSFILFLNKIDLFKKKLRKSPLERYFPEYNGGDDYQKAAKFMLWRFKQVNKHNLDIYPHLTCATDTKQIRIVVAAVRDTLFKNSLKTSGLMM